MRQAEVELNTKVTFQANDREHRAFKIACVEQGREMGEIFRQFERDFVAQHKKRERELSKTEQ